jgi:hypothetical protein
MDEAGAPPPPPDGRSRRDAACRTTMDAAMISDQILANKETHRK